MKKLTEPRRYSAIRLGVYLKSYRSIFTQILKVFEMHHHGNFFKGNLPKLVVIFCDLWFQFWGASCKVKILLCINNKLLKYCDFFLNAAVLLSYYLNIYGLLSKFVTRRIILIVYNTSLEFFFIFLLFTSYNGFLVFPACFCLNACLKFSWYIVIISQQIIVESMYMYSVKAGEPYYHSVGQRCAADYVRGCRKKFI